MVRISAHVSPLHNVTIHATVTRLNSSLERWKIHQLDVKKAFQHGNLKELDSTLKEMGFLQCVQEKVVYRKVPNEEFIIVAVNVEDLFVTGASLDLINEFKKRMASQFEMSNLGELTYYLGIEVSQGKDCMKIKQERYAMKILTEASMEDYNATLCPMESGLKLLKEKDKLLNIEKRWVAYVTSCILVHI
nr:putative retroelement Pol polyprotein [Tanacetum cinerariifolium]